MQQPVQRWRCFCRRVARVCCEASATKREDDIVWGQAGGGGDRFLRTTVLGALGRPDCGQRIKNAARGIDEIIRTAFT